MIPAISNSISLFSAYALARVFSFVFTIILPKYYTDKPFSAYLFAVTLSNMMVILTELGMQSPLIREMAVHRDRIRELASNALTMRLILCVVAFGCISGYVHILGYPSSTIKIVYIVSISELVNSISLLFRYIFRASERMIYESVTVAVDRIIVLLVGLKVITGGYEIESFCWVLAGASVFTLIVSAVIVRARFVKIGIGFSGKVWGEIMMWSLPFALANVFNMVYYKQGMLILDKLGTKEMFSWFGIAYTVMMALLVLPGAFSGAIYPVVSKMFAADKRESLARAYNISVKLMFVVGVPLAVVISGSAREIVLLFYSPERFPEGTIDAALRTLSWAVPLSFLNAVMMSFYRASDKRRAFTIATGCNVAINFIATYILVTRMRGQGMAHVGTAGAMVISEGLFLLISFAYMRRVLRLKLDYRMMIKPVICVAALLLVMKLMPPIHQFVTSAVGCLIYASLILATKSVTREELRSLQT